MVGVGGGGWGFVGGGRPIFIATLWAGASWLFFRVARSTRMTQIWVLSLSHEAL